MRLALALLTAGMLLAVLGEAAADPPRASVPEVKEDPKYVEGVQAVKRRDYPAAIRCFEDVVARDDRNANAYNWLGYSIRQSGDATRSIPVYEKALAIDPKHKGAHEYIGEAFLVLGNLAKAKEHLAILDKLCFLPCEEYSDLKKAVREYESGGGRLRPASTTN